MRQLVITISTCYLDRLNAVAERLRRDGLTITHLYEFGIIIGTAAQENIAKIGSYREIIALTEEQAIDLPPPESDIQ